MGEGQSTLKDFHVPKFDKSIKFNALHLSKQTLDFFYGDTEDMEAITHAKFLCKQSHLFAGCREELVEEDSNWFKCTFRDSVFVNFPFSADDLDSERVVRLQFINCLVENLLRVNRRLILTPKLLRKSMFNHSAFVWAYSEVCNDWQNAIYPHNSEERKVITMDLAESNQLSFVNINNSVMAKLHHYLVDTHPIVQVSNYLERPDGFYDIHLQGDPWSTSSSNCGRGRQLLLNLLEYFSNEGYALCGSANTGSAESMYFVHDSNKPNKAYSGEGAFFLLSLEKHNLMRIVCREDSLKERLREEICSGWLSNGGLTTEDTDDDTCLLRLQGNPWRHYKTDKEGIDTKLLLTNLFQSCWRQGWRVTAAVEKNDHYKSIFVFQACHPEAKGNVIAISFVGKWLIRIFNAPKFLVDKIKYVIHRKWYREVLVEEVTEFCWIISLGGHPWSANVIPALTLIVHMVQALQELSYYSLLSGRVSGVYEKGTYVDDKGKKRPFHQAEVHTLWFAKA